jgi:hypothetical protein
MNTIHKLVMETLEMANEAYDWSDIEGVPMPGDAQ